MRKLFHKILSLILSIILVANFSLPAFAASDETSSPDNSSLRTNITYVDGYLGALHVVYTYVQNGQTYKVEESASSDFSQVDSYTYLLNTDSSFSLLNTQHISTNDESISITTINAAGDTTTQNIPIVLTQKSSVPSILSSNEWVTEYEDGNTYVGNLTVYGIIAVLQTIANKLYPQAEIITNTIAAVASALFGINAQYCYYHKIGNWRHSNRNYLVIEVTEYTKFYSDSGHTKYLGDSYAEWLDN